MCHLESRTFLADVKFSISLPSAMAIGNIPDSDFRASLATGDDEMGTKLPSNMQQTYSVREKPVVLAH